MLELLKKAGLTSGLAAAIVIAVTAVPIFYQYKYTVQQNERITALEAKVTALEAKK